MDLTEQFKDRDSFLHWFLIAALTGIEITEEVKSLPRDVTLQINGTELNPLRAINRLEVSFNRLVEEKANEIVEEKVRDILDPFEDQMDELKDTIREQISDKVSTKGNFWD